jgi:hemerythrin
VVFAKSSQIIVIQQHAMLGWNLKRQLTGGQIMALIQWNGSLSVSVAEIDKQHQKLVKMINELHEAMLQAKGSAAVGPLLNELVEYAGTHFKAEEKYFVRFAYPDAAAHKKLHADFVDKVLEFKKRFEANTVGLSMEVMTFLSNWLQAHIKGEDKKYTACFNANGLK